MKRMVDMHCHILPEVDDGARSIEETRQMLQKAYEDGIRYIIATPHYHPRRGRKSPTELRRQLKLVREEAARISDKLRVYLGAEIYFGQDIPEKLREERILTMNRTNYVLVEFSPGDTFEYICQGIQQIQLKGYKVILAHIERYQCIYKAIENAEHLKHMGVYIQVNAGSITGEAGWKTKRLARQLLDRRLVFCVGTDAHDPKKRRPRMKKAAEYVEQKCGEDYARRIFFSNPRIMLRKKRKNNESGKNNGNRQ